MRRHSHRNEIAYKKVEDVRYVLQTVTGINEDEIDVCMFTGTSSEWMSINNEFSRVRRTVESADSFIERGPRIRFEIQSRDLPYLEKPEGDWEFRKVEVGDDHMGVMRRADGSIHHGGMFTFSIGTGSAESILSGYRWCAPRKVGFELWWEDHGRNFGGGYSQFKQDVEKAYNAGKESK